jgi:hypothetical protein
MQEACVHVLSSAVHRAWCERGCPSGFRRSGLGGGDAYFPSIWVADRIPAAFGTVGREEKSTPIIKLRWCALYLVERDRRLSAVYAGFVKDVSLNADFCGSNGHVIRPRGTVVSFRGGFRREHTAGGELVPVTSLVPCSRDTEIRMRMEMFLSTGRLP